MIAKWLKEDFLKTIVLFELPDGKGGFAAHGTGVLIIYESVAFLATCKHIVIKPDGTPYRDLQATINKTDGSASRKNIDDIHARHKLKWFFHTNPSVDLALCAIEIDLKTEDIRTVGEDLFEDFANIPIGDDIFFLGYPLGLGIQNVPKLSPLVRTGIVALKRSDNIFLIDANVYPGSSGSPVFYKPVLAQTEGANTNIGTGRAIKFLGIVSSNLNYSEPAVSSKTGRIRTVFEENAGLGLIFSTTLLIEIFNYSEVQDFVKSIQPVKPAEETTPSNGHPPETSTTK